MKLSIQIEFDKTLDLETPKTSVIVGRSPKVDLVIPHGSISRQHCQIDVDKNIFYITDLGSSNGSFIDGQKLEPQVKTPFISSQQLTLGKLECEITESSASTETKDKVVSSILSPKGDASATIRLSRIDLNRPVMTAEIEKKKKLNGPRNPVTMDDEEEVPKAKKSKKMIIIAGLILALAAAWFFAPAE